MRNYCHVHAIDNGTVVMYLVPEKAERRGPRGVVLREVDRVAEGLGVAWRLRWKVVFCKDLEEVEKAVRQAFHADEESRELEKKGVDLHIVQEPGAVYASQGYAGYA